MTAATKEGTAVALEGDGVELRKAEIGGEMSVAFIHLPKGTDMTPGVKGLPGDMCQCPHWGYVFKGRLQLKTTEGDETYEAGQAFYWRPGHIPVALEDVEFIDFSPTLEFDRVLDHVKSQMS